MLLVVDEVVRLDQLQQAFFLLRQPLLFSEFQEEDVERLFGLFQFALERTESLFYLYALLTHHREDLLQLAPFVFVLLPRGELLPNVRIFSVYALDLPRQEGADYDGRFGTVLMDD